MTTIYDSRVDEFIFTGNRLIDVIGDITDPLDPPDPIYDPEIIGTAGGDRIFAGLNRDTVQGMGGDDLIFGGSGADTIYGDARDELKSKGADTIWGGSGVDVIFGGHKRDVIRGGGDPDYLFGEWGRDRIIGGEGTDRIEGGHHDDKLTGGRGVDHFYFRYYPELQPGQLGTDTITDFEAWADMLVFDASLEGQLEFVQDRRTATTTIQMGDTSDALVLDGLWEEGDLQIFWM